MPPVCGRPQAPSACMWVSANVLDTPFLNWGTKLWIFFSIHKLWQFFSIHSFPGLWHWIKNCLEQWYLQVFQFYEWCSFSGVGRGGYFYGKVGSLGVSQGHCKQPINKLVSLVSWRKVCTFPATHRESIAVLMKLVMHHLTQAWPVNLQSLAACHCFLQATGELRHSVITVRTQL